MPYVSQFSTKKSSRRFKRPSRPNLKALVSRAIENSKETKYSQNTTLEIAAAKGNPPIFFDFSTLIPGTGSNSRVGNTVLCKQLGVRSIYNNNSATAPTIIREVVLEVNGGYYQSNTDIATALFEGGTDVTYSLFLDDCLRKIQKDGIRVLSDRLVTISAQTVASSDSGIETRKWSKKMNQRLIFRDNAIAQSINKRYVVMVLARDPANDVGAGTTECTICTEMYYKDM